MPTKKEIDYTRISWNRAKNRCHNPKDPDYHRYGARGIVVCPRWRYSFENFFEDMGVRPHKQTLDRIDSKGNYEKDNCRWATSKTQNRHAQNLITFAGETRPLGEWAEVLGINQTTLSMRLRRMTVEQAFTTPVMR
jgi:hypothetical protein